MNKTCIAEIEAQFPELAPVSATELGEGCDSAALLVNDAWVFRFPKSQDVERQLATEAALLRVLERRLPIPVPRFQYLGRPGEHFPRAFVGYPMLEGAPSLSVAADELPLPEVARIGTFLAALHGVDVDEARRCGVLADDLHGSMFEIRDEALQVLKEVARLAPDAPLEVWRAFLSAPPVVAPGHRRVLSHNDLAAEHLLFGREPVRLTGVIDWTDAAITHPCVDFAGLFHWGGDAFAGAVLDSYCRRGGRLDPDGLRIAKYLGAARGAEDVAFGIEMQRPDYVSGGLRALRMCCHC